jgi:hypothetical protein
MKKLELVRNSVGGLDLIVERDAGNPVRILTGKNSLKFFKELRKFCNTAIDTLNQENGPGIDSDEFRAWKDNYAEMYPANFATLNDEELYKIFYTT